MNFIVVSSSRGTTFQSVLDRIKDGTLTATCLGLITDRTDRGCIEKAKKAGLPFSVIERRENEERETYMERLQNEILNLVGDASTAACTEPSRSAQHDVYLACMGWMWILTPSFIERWKGKILNVHPALLPKHGGKGMYGHHVHEAVLAAHEKESGITIHVMDSGVDTGKILLQKTCPVLPDDTPTTLQARVQELEKEWYPKVLQMIEEGASSSFLSS